MTSLIFWAAVALFAFWVGYRSRRAKASAAKQSPGPMRVVRAIGSPIELILLGGFVLLLWYWGAFSSDEAIFLWGVFAMIAVPVAVVFLAFQSMGRSAASDEDDA